MLNEIEHQIAPAVIANEPVLSPKGTDIPGTEHFAGVPRMFILDREQKRDLYEE